MKTATRFVAVPMMALTILASGAGFQINQAQAALTAVGPTNPTTGFPLWYQDANGLKLGLMEAADNFGISAPVVAGNAFSETIGFGAEGFWWSADASATDTDGVGSAILVLALEAAFSGGEIPTDGEQSAFGRIRIRVDGLTPGASYTITHPYATVNEVADGAGVINTTSDIGGFGVPGFPANFNIPLTSGVGPFLTWDTFNPVFALNDPALKNPTPAFANRVYLGNATPHTITPGPNGADFTVAGPGVTSMTTNLFAVTGRLFAPVVTVTSQTSADTTPAVTGTVSDPTATVAVTIVGDAANTNVAATVNPTTGAWSATLPSALAKGTYDVQVTVGAGTLNETVDTKVDALNIETTVHSPLFRFFSALNRKHFYTADPIERDSVIANFTDQEWLFEGESLRGFPAGSNAINASPVFRFFSAQNQAHFYTIDPAERDATVANFTDAEWLLEGETFQAYRTEQPNSKPVYRFWSAQNKAHFFTDDPAEKDATIANFTDAEWLFEGVAYWVPNF